MVLFGGEGFTWIEYQVLMLCLAGAICSTLFFVEIALNRFQVLPLLFPGMFRVQERRFYFFNFDISDGAMGKSVRAEAKMVVRMTICLVLSYLWQHCVLETTQQVGTDFPEEACAAGADCFASTLHFYTFFNRQHEAVDCKQNNVFEKRVVISCIRFITPTGTTWLMHLAISHSITQLNFKAFELMIWIGGNSKWARRLIGVLIFMSLCSLLGLFFGGILSEFVSSWLSFVMSLTIPMFLYTTYKNGKHLELLWKEEAVKVQQHIEEHLSGAFADIETTVNTEVITGQDGKVIHGMSGGSDRLGQNRSKDLNKRDSHKVIKTLRSMKSALSNSVRRSKESLSGRSTPPSTPGYQNGVATASSAGSGDDTTWMNAGSGDVENTVRDRSHDSTGKASSGTLPGRARPPQLSPREMATL